ncbi:MAG: hypothetical protein FWH14_08815 [Oscillospiraceae bacterium]|nr:hypothetical protein [Oscillospiraceae bacterium]
MANTRNKVAIVFDGVVVPWCPRKGGCFSPWLLQFLWVFLPLPLGEVSRRGRDGEGDILNSALI